jgi:microcystin-dependent protein
MGNRLAWRDDRDRMATVNTEADLNNRTLLPASHLKPGKLVYVSNEGVLYECLNDSSTLTNTLADWKEVGIGSTIRAGRVGNLPTATSTPPPVPNQLAIVTFDVDGNAMDRLYVWELNTATSTYSWVPLETRSAIKALRSDTDVSHDLAPGDVQYTVEQGHAEIKVADATGTLQTIFSKDAIDAAIAAGNQFQGTVQDTGHGVRGAIDFAALPKQSALGAADKSHYWIYVGTPGHAIGVNEIGGVVSAVDGQVLNVGDWIIVGSTTTGTGPAAVTTYQYNVIPGDLLAKARGDNLYGFNAWAAGAYEAGSIVTYKGDVWKATGAVVRTDAAPGTPASSGPPAVTAPPWAKVDISGGVRSVASDADLPATAANGTIYLVLSSAANGGKQTLFSYDNPNSKWEQLSGGGSASGGNLQLTGGTPVHNIGVPIGTVIMYASALAPAGYLLCDGTNISATTYPELATVLGTTKLPDLRNMFVRGWSGVGGTLDHTTQHQDTTRLPRTAFTATAANAGSHTHNLWQRRMNAYTGEAYVSIPNTSAEGISAGGSTNTDGRNMDADGAHTHAITIAGGDTETAPKHVILAYYIKATDTGMRIV